VGEKIILPFGKVCTIAVKILSLPIFFERKSTAVWKNALISSRNEKYFYHQLRDILSRS